MSQRQQVRRVQELRRSAAASPVPSGKRYQRRPKYKVQWEKTERGART